MSIVVSVPKKIKGIDMISNYIQQFSIQKTMAGMAPSPTTPTT
jgi:hypothetical protein